VPTVTFKVGFAQIIVQECIVLECGKCEFVGMKVQRPFENAEGFLFAEDANGQKVADK
jgi:hypothetical protein